MAKQLAFADLLGDRSWDVNVREGRVSFGSDLSYPIQLLGTESEGDSSWLWAWANEASNLPPDVLKAGNRIRAFGAKESIREFEDANFPLETANGHTIALVASGLNPRSCYYRGPYDGGALFFLVSGLPEHIVGPVDSQRAITVITNIISQFEVNHLEMSRSFLQTQGFVVQHNDDVLEGSRGADFIQISFDKQNRIENIEGTVNPAQTVRKSWWKFWK